MIARADTFDAIVNALRLTASKHNLDVCETCNIIEIHIRLFKYKFSDLHGAQLSSLQVGMPQRGGLMQSCAA